MYAITNAYAVQDGLKANGATWDAGRKAWIVTDAVFAKLQARTRSFGMSWANGWAKAVKVKIEETSSTPDWQNDPKCGFVE